MNEEQQNQYLLERTRRMIERKKKLESTLTRAGVRIKKLSFLGLYVHIDTYKKYEKSLAELMTQAGFTCIAAKNGRHLDGYTGFRMSFKLPG